MLIQLLSFHSSYSRPCFRCGRLLHTAPRHQG
jgi:hypothetical protein